MVRGLRVIKKSRHDPIPDIPINFSPLDNLHLEMMEVKSKIRRGAPLVPSSRRRHKQREREREEEDDSDQEELSDPRPGRERISSPDHKHHRREREEGHRSTHSPPSAGTPRRKPSKEDLDLIKVLGDEDGVPDSIEIEFADDSDVDSDEGDSDEEDDENSDVEEDSDNSDDEDDIYTGMTEEEKEAHQKEDLLWKFTILKKKYRSPTVPIPDFNQHSDLGMMRVSYDRTVRELMLDNSVETYRSYLVGGFIIMEFACTQWIGVDLGGFTLQQTKMMYKYDRLLIELGERPYNTWGSSLPVEVKLLGFILLQAGIFYLGKIISDRFGNSVAELFKGVTGQPPAAVTTASSDAAPSPRPKRRMRGPRIKPDDIRSMPHTAGKVDDDD